MKFHGKHVVVRPMSSLIRGIENLSVDDYSILPPTTTIYCTKAPLIIGKNVCLVLVVHLSQVIIELML